MVNGETRRFGAPQQLVTRPGVFGGRSLISPTRIFGRPPTIMPKDVAKAKEVQRRLEEQIEPTKTPEQLKQERIATDLKNLTEEETRINIRIDEIERAKRQRGFETSSERQEFAELSGRSIALAAARGRIERGEITLRQALGLAAQREAQEVREAQQRQALIEAGEPLPVTPRGRRPSEIREDIRAGEQLRTLRTQFEEGKITEAQFTSGFSQVIGREPTEVEVMVSREKIPEGKEPGAIVSESILRDIEIRAQEGEETAQEQLRAIGGFVPQEDIEKAIEQFETRKRLERTFFERLTEEGFDITEDIGIFRDPITGTIQIGIKPEGRIEIAKALKTQELERGIATSVFERLGETGESIARLDLAISKGARESQLGFLFAPTTEELLLSRLPVEKETKEEIIKGVEELKIRGAGVTAQIAPFFIPGVAPIATSLLLKTGFEAGAFAPSDELVKGIGESEISLLRREQLVEQISTEGILGIPISRKATIELSKAPGQLEFAFGLVGLRDIIGAKGQVRLIEGAGLKKPTKISFGKRLLKEFEKEIFTPKQLERIRVLKAQEFRARQNLLDTLGLTVDTAEEFGLIGVAPKVKVLAESPSEIARFKELQKFGLIGRKRRPVGDFLSQVLVVPEKELPTIRKLALQKAERESLRRLSLQEVIGKKPLRKIRRTPLEKELGFTPEQLVKIRDQKLDKVLFDEFLLVKQKPADVSKIALENVKRAELRRLALEKVLKEKPKKTPLQELGFPTERPLTEFERRFFSRRGLLGTEDDIAKFLQQEVILTKPKPTDISKITLERVKADELRRLSLQEVVGVKPAKRVKLTPLEKEIFTPEQIVKIRQKVIDKSLVDEFILLKPKPTGLVKLTEAERLRRLSLQAITPKVKVKKPPLSKSAQKFINQEVVLARLQVSKAQQSLLTKMGRQKTGIEKAKLRKAGLSPTQEPLVTIIDEPIKLDPFLADIGSAKARARGEIIKKTLRSPETQSIKQVKFTEPEVPKGFQAVEDKSTGLIQLVRTKQVGVVKDISKGKLRPPTTKQFQALRDAFRTDISAITSQVVKPKLTEKGLFVPRQQLQLKQELNVQQLLAQPQTQVLRQQEALAQPTRLALRQPQILIQPQRLIQRERLRELFRLDLRLEERTKVLLPPIKIEKKKKKEPKKPEQAYDVFAKPIKLKGKKQKPLRKVNLVPLKKKQAERLRDFTLDTSLGRTGEIRKVKGKPKEPRIPIRSVSPSKFRKFKQVKGKRKPLKLGKVIEKGKFLLDTPQERRKIAVAKRIQQLRGMAKVKPLGKSKKPKQLNTRKSLQDMALSL
jgi:hypothetical protein